MSDIWDLTPEEAFAEQLVDEAMAGMDIPDDMRPILRVRLLGELLTTPEGKAKLRRAMADPRVARSGDVARPGAQEDASKPVAKRAGSKRGKPS